MLRCVHVGVDPGIQACRRTFCDNNIGGRPYELSILKVRNNRARAIIFEIGWGPGCGVGGPGSGVLDIHSTSGLPPLLLLSRPPPGPPTPQPEPQLILKITAIAQYSYFSSSLRQIQ